MLLGSQGWGELRSRSFKLARSHQPRNKKDGKIEQG